MGFRISTDISIFGVVSFCVSVGACVYTYFGGRKIRKQALDQLDALTSELKADQDKRLKRFDHTVDELDSTDVEINLTQDVQEKVLYDVATKAIETETVETQRRVREEYSAEIRNAARDEAETCRRELKPWVQDEYKKEIAKMDLRSEKKTIVRDVKYDLEKECRDDLDAFMDECKASIKRVSDSCSDSASEVYKVAKDIREKAMK